MASGSPLRLVRFDTSDRLVTWEAAGEDCRIVCPEALLESIRRECALAARGPVPLGMGGALLGEASGGTYRLRAWHPIPCQHQRGPSFLLSKDEVAGLKEFLSHLPARTGSAGDQIVGWFVSHPHSGAVLRDDEISLHQRFFRARDLFLLLEIDARGAAEVTVHRGASPLEPQWRVVPTADLRRKAGDAGGTAAEALRDPGFSAGGNAAASGDPASHKGRWIALLLLGAILGSGSYLYVQYRQREDSVSARTLAPLTTASLSVEREGGGFLVRWRLDEAALAQASRVALRIEDSGQAHEAALDSEAVRRGSLFHATESAVVEVEMRLEFPDGTFRRERVRYQP
ncbi:MAG: hypothetical protein N2036_05055 [Bryobacteraceae bacterium]|nr:hypothetical protein [Bryobacteraceae bacterium]